jgi:beta-mannosidase
LRIHRLNGSWDAWTDQSVADSWYRTDFDQAAEHSLPVPGHWQLTPSLSRHHGSVFYRTTFDLTPEYDQLAWRLQLGGAFYLSAIWVNGQRIAQQEGYFQPLLVEIPADLLQTSGNVIALRVDCPPPGKTYRDTIMGAFGDWDGKPDWVNSGGIWGNVLLIGSRGGFCRQLSISQRLTAWNAAQVRLNGHLVWRGTRDRLQAVVTLSPRNFRGKMASEVYHLPAEAGDNQFRFQFSLPDPKLWWTWDLGHPSLYDLELVIKSSEGYIIDYYRTHLGFRSIRWDKWQLFVNDQRLFLRGCNYTPASFYPAQLTREELQQDAALITAANLNAVRVHAHVAHPDFYLACAERGILVWQDFPLDKRYGHQIIEPAITQIRQMVSLLAKEPAIVFWACHNEPYVLPARGGYSSSRGSGRFWRSLVRSSRPTWNKDVLDHRLRAAVLQVDTTRPVFAYSGVFGFVRGGSDTHQYFGWNTPSYRTLQTVARLFPQTLRLVSEYGAQSWPADEQFLREAMSEAEWPHLPWHRLRQRYLLDDKQLHRKVRPEDYPDIGAYALATQEYQAELLQFYHETLRLKRFHPVAGAFMYSFRDSLPVVSWSLLDWQKRPKLAYQVTKRAMRPLQVMVSWPKPRFAAGSVWRTNAFVVNDLQQPLVAMGLSWQLLSPTGEVVASERRIVDARADQVTAIGKLSLAFPEDQVGIFTLLLKLELPSGERIGNSYRLRVVI